MREAISDLSLQEWKDRSIMWMLADMADLGRDRGSIGTTPLHVAAEEGQVDLVMLLISKGADVHAMDKIGATPLHVAVKAKKSEAEKVNLVHLLLEKGADRTTGDCDGRTALHYAAVEGKHVVAHLLAVHQDDVNQRDDSGQTPLHVAAYEGHASLVEMFKKRGANIDMQESLGGRTPLHMALVRDNEQVEQIVWCLVQGEADVNIKDNAGSTPLHLAASMGNKNVLRMLLSGGGDPELEDQKGMTVYQLAYYSGCQDILWPAMQAKGKDREVITEVVGVEKGPGHIPHSTKKS